MNILANGIKAIHRKGEILIRTAAEEKQVTIRIAEKGKGMPEELRKRIFEPFFTTKEMGQGAGLGLSISYQIIAQHQGSIDVLSEPGTGTEFILTLPRTQSN
jgi:signal transduction histidine kinase